MLRNHLGVLSFFFKCSAIMVLKAIITVKLLMDVVCDTGKSVVGYVQALSSDCSLRFWYLRL